MTARPRLWPVVTATALAFVLLCGLGTWQLQRLQWKSRLVDTITTKLAAEPVPLAALTLDQAAEFTKVAVEGKYLPQETRLMFATAEGVAGWQVITPLQMSDGHVLLVDRGFIAAEGRAAILAETPGQAVKATGILRLHGEGRPSFSPDNDLAGNNWYWWDLPAMMASLRLPEGTTTVPAVLQRIPDPANQEVPQPRPPAAKLVNNHLQYAVTWFVFAGVLLVISGLFIRGQMKKSHA